MQGGFQSSNPEAKMSLATGQLGQEVSQEIGFTTAVKCFPRCLSPFVFLRCFVKD